MRCTTVFIVLLGLFSASKALPCGPPGSLDCTLPNCASACMEYIDGSYPPRYLPCACEDPPCGFPCAPPNGGQPNTGIWQCGSAPYCYCPRQATCYPPTWTLLQAGGACGGIDAQWDAPRGSLVLVNTGSGSDIQPIMAAVGENYTHSILAESPSTASQSEGQRPGSGSCDYPLSVNDLQNNLPGAQRQMNMGATYAEIYGGGSVLFVPDSPASDIVIWHQGDPGRANAIADFISSLWTSTYFRDSLNPPIHQPIQRAFMPGGLSPYTFHQYMDIETRHLLDGTSLRNGTVCSTFNAQVYASSWPPPPPVQPFSYDHLATGNAATAMSNSVFDKCMRADLGWLVDLFCGDRGVLCSKARNQVMNCFVTGNCNDISYTYTTVWNDPNARAYSISPDRLGAHSHFAGDFQTTWSQDQVLHPIQWSRAGATYGCYK